MSKFLGTNSVGSGKDIGKDKPAFRWELEPFNLWVLFRAMALGSVLVKKRCERDAMAMRPGILINSHSTHPARRRPARTHACSCRLPVYSHFPRPPSRATPSTPTEERHPPPTARPGGATRRLNPAPALLAAALHPLHGGGWPLPPPPPYPPPPPTGAFEPHPPPAPAPQPPAAAAGGPPPPPHPPCGAPHVLGGAWDGGPGGMYPPGGPGGAGMPGRPCTRVRESVRQGVSG